MSAACYPQRKGDYVYNVSVTKDEELPLSRRYHAHLNDVEHIQNGRPVSVKVDVPDAYGPTVTEAMRALDAGFETWRREHLPKHQ
jgi:hypothetical protein